MRPVRLEVEGFTCYRERQSPLLFDGLSLFAIAGPTGAGKSSILDAMLFALYGKVPRIGKQGIGECIAQGLDAMSVSLDFTIRSATYRVARRVRRGRRNLSTQATLAELTPDGERSIADAVTPVNDAVQKLLGLDFDAFTQTVILPQGDFARFLQAEPKERRAILQHLLRHEIFERMRLEAERRRGESDQAVKVLERHLASFQHATTDALATARQELETRRTALVELTALKDARASALEDLRVRRRLTEEAFALQGRLASLDAEAPAVIARREELAAARRAAEIVPRIEAVTEARHRLDTATRERSAAEVAVASKQAAIAELDVRVVTAETEAARTTELRQRIRALDEIRGELTRRDALRTELRNLSRTLPQVRDRATGLARNSADARTARLAAERDVTQARALLASSGFDAAEEQRLHDVWDTTVQLRAIDEEVVALSTRQSALGAEVVTAERALVSTEAALRVCADDAEAATVAEAEAADAREAGRTRHQAAAVREHLHAGEACPVCLQTVVLMPPPERVPELGALDAAHDEAKRRRASAVRAQQAAAESFAGARAHLLAAQQASDRAAAALHEKTEARRVLHGVVAQALAGAVAVPDGSSLIAVVEERRAAMRSARQAHDRASTQVRQAEARLAEADVALAKAEGDARVADEALARMLADETARQQELDALNRRITAVSTQDDPAAERATVAREIETLEFTLRTAQARLAAARPEASAAEARFAAANATTAQCADAFAAAEATLQAAVVAAGFASVDAVKPSIRSSAQQAVLDEAVRQHESDYAGTLNRLLVVQPQIAGREVSAQALAAAEEEHEATFAAWRQADLDVAGRQSIVQRLTEEVAQRAVHETELATLRAHLALHSAMASDLRTDEFQEYLLEEAFHALVAGASVRMRQMSNRYTMEWNEGAFYVVDHDNAGERRRAETLSGGETFMASLCLALQLSDEVLKTSGALQMDSIFIDEGFGTLDADTLTDVTDAMEALRQDAGRLIGVISHRPELTDRLPGCIRIARTRPGESTWTLERVG